VSEQVDRVLQLVRDGQTMRSDAQIGLDDFRAVMADHRYIFIPTRELWPASSVDARLPWPMGPANQLIRPSRYLDEQAPVEQLVWAPGEPMLIKGKVLQGGGWVEHAGVTAFNLYRDPLTRPGNPDDVAPWLNHVCRVYPRDHEHLVRWLAHRVQRPGQKINHALVLGGKQGIGKDTILEPIKVAIGPWNFQEISPGALLGRFNGFAKSVILRISEARDLGELDRFAFYDHLKVYTAAPPDVLRCDEKNIREHSVLNVCGVIITTNHKSDGIYLPADDRRHFVAWSDACREEFNEGYWNELWGWYAAGGIANVSAYLARLDLNGFDAKAPPPKTDAFWHIVNASRTPEEAELADVIDALKRPNVITLALLKQQASMKFPEFADWLSDRRNRRQIPYRIEAAGYEPVRNDASKDGLWVISERRQVAYARAELSVRDRIQAVRDFQSLGSGPDRSSW